MIRIFRHYLSAKLMLVMALETLIFVVSIRLGLAFEFATGQISESRSLSLIPTAVFAVGMLIVMNAVGLYSSDAWTNKTTIRTRLAAVVLLVIGLISAVAYLPPSLVLDPDGL